LPSIITEVERLLLRQIAEGDEKAFEEVFHAYRDKLYAFIYQISHSKEIAEDTVQDVFLKIWNIRRRLSDIENFNAFLFQMSKNHVINQLRRMSRETLMLIERQAYKTEVPTPDQQVIYKNIYQMLDRIIDNLPQQQKTVYRLSRESHLKQEEIAQKLAISQSTVKNHMTQALRTIRFHLEKYYKNMMLAGTLSIALWG